MELQVLLNWLTVLGNLTEHNWIRTNWGGKVPKYGPDSNRSSSSGLCTQSYRILNTTGVPSGFHVYCKRYKHRLPGLLELLQPFHTEGKHFGGTLWKAVRCGATILKPHETQQACSAHSSVQTNKVVPAPATQPQTPYPLNSQGLTCLCWRNYDSC